MSRALRLPTCTRLRRRPLSRWRLGTLTLFSLAFLAGCQPSATPPQPADPPSRPAEILEIGATDLGSGLRFPGRVRAVQRAELAFDVPGRILEFPVVEGQRVEAGELIARLDPSAFETRLAAAQAELDQATTDYERVRQLWEKSQAVARAEVDLKRTAMEVARSGFAAARKDLDDSQLIAPFAGVIARRHVENFQTVQAKEPVVSLQDVGDLEIVIHVPERVIRTAPRRAAGHARFADLPGRRFAVTLKSFATEADPQTQTYEIVLGLSRPLDVRILPGMSVDVFPERLAEDAAGKEVRIPLKAIVAGPEGQPIVWVVDPESTRVARRPIEVGPVDGADILVLSGLEPGERIVTAGVHQLRDGMRVRPLGGDPRSTDP
ncbi:MAG: efflux RND transporter periplasmic adaptor subunit [Chromatiaceae bacterium]|nr:efflux RND transporter periplasmic adaptor subunit [Chromatiaceae bacterium]